MNVENLIPDLDPIKLRLLLGLTLPLFGFLAIVGLVWCTQTAFNFLISRWGRSRPSTRSRTSASARVARSTGTVTARANLRRIR